MTTRAAMIDLIDSLIARWSETGGPSDADAKIDLLADEIETLRAAAAALAAEDWRPIAECPEEWKDGRDVLLSDGRYSYEAWHHNAGAWFLANTAPSDMIGSQPFDGATDVRLMPAPPAREG